MSVVGYGRPERFRIGRVFGDTFRVLGRNFVLYAGLAAIFSGIPSFLYGLLSESKANLYTSTSEQVSRHVFGVLIAFVIYLVLALILQAALVRATIEDLNGKQPTFGDALSRAFALLLPIIGLSILMSLGIGLGFALLFVPGIYLAVRWSAAVPVLVHEQRGIFESMKRSSELTKGSRWRIFGLYIVLFIAIWFLELVLGLLVAVVTPLLGAVIGALLMAILSAGVSLILTIAVAVAYVELRYVKEGADVSELAEIFA